MKRLMVLIGFKGRRHKIRDMLIMWELRYTMGIGD